MGNDSLVSVSGYIRDSLSGSGIGNVSITYKEAGVDSTPDTCKQFLETVPSIPRDPRDMDDVDTDCEDHIAMNQGIGA